MVITQPVHGDSHLYAWPVLAQRGPVSLNNLRISTKSRTSD